MTVETSLESLVARATARVRTTSRRVLVSTVEQIPSIDPLEALEALEAASETGRFEPEVAAHAAARAYWTRPADGFALAGLGTAISLSAAGIERFSSIDERWTRLLDEALVIDRSGGVPGAGPALLGGFAFDPEMGRTAAWDDFPEARLTVPLLQIVARGGDCWLTTSLVVGPGGEPNVTLADVARLRSALLDARSLAPEAPAPVTDQHTDDDTDDDTDGELLACTDARDASAWRATVRDAVDSIRRGAIEKVVLARQVNARAARDFDVAETLRQLRYAHPACYVFGFWSGDSAFVGATPERLVRVDGREVQASSLAGSARRGATPADDAAQVQELFASAKDRSEHEIVRRALCAGLERLCDDVTAADMPTLLSLPQVHHLHTAVHARLRAGHTILQLVAELHPTPAVGGAPRDAALRFIRDNEKMDRGWYAGPVGWLQRGRGEFAVALRSALVTESRALLFAGCGIVADSEPGEEYAESLLKLRPMQTALAAALTLARAADDLVAEIEQASAFSGDAL